MSNLKIVVDRDTCAACDICAQIAEATFVIDEEAKAAVKDPQGDPRDTIIEAAESCPTGAITVVDSESGETIVGGG
jgi:ferredoxin